MIEARPARPIKFIYLGALMMIVTAGCATGSSGAKADAHRAAAELTGRGGPAEGRVTLRHLENFQLCAERNPQALPGLARLEIEVGIDPSGRVLSSRVTAVAPGTEGLAACVARALTWIEFERAAGTYRHYQLGLAKGADGRVLVDLTDLDAPQRSGDQPAKSKLPGIPAELAGALTGVADRD